MTYFWIKFFECLQVSCIVGTFPILAFEIKDIRRLHSRWPASHPAMRSHSSLRRRTVRLSAICVLWTATCVCQLVVRDDPGSRLFYATLALFFLALALFSMQVPRIGRYIRRKRFTADPERMLHLSK